MTSLWSLRFCALLISCALSAFAAPTSERFRLHKVEQPIGLETDSISDASGALQIDSAFEFTDRGTTVPLKATFRCSRDYTPSFFTISGSTSRSSKIDLDVHVSGHSASVRDGKSTRDAPVPTRFFTIVGYAPAAMQEALVQYWTSHGKPAQLAILPSGTIDIAARGKDTFAIGGTRVTFQRYSVRGLVWGLETLWMDDKNHLAAVVTRDAEFDHFEAVREGYEPALADFISAGAKDEIASLVELNKTLEGRQAGTLAFTGATLIDGTGKAPISPAVVVARDGKILAAGPAGAINIPPDAKRIDAAGKYIIPGLWDMHAHYEQVEWGPIYLAAGVTTARDVGNEFGFITAVRKANNSGQGLGPRLLLAGIVDGDGPMALGVQRVNSAADAAEWVKRYHDAGFQQMKIYSSVKPEVVKAVCENAHALGMTVTGHIPNGMSILDGIAAGMDQVNHINYVVQAFLPKDFNRAKPSPAERMKAMESIDPSSEDGRRVIAFLKQHDTVIDDTAALFELETAPTNEPGIANVAPELEEQFKNIGVPEEALAAVKLSWSKILEILAALHQAGIRLVAGTDQAVPGYSVYREIEIYVEAGFTPMEALQAATLIPAQAMKVDSDSGTVETGKRADFDILDANPLDDIHNIRTVRWVVANGTLYDPAPLWRSVGFKPPR